MFTSSSKRRMRKFHVVAPECDVLLMIYWRSRCRLCPGFLRSLLIDIQEQNIRALVARSLYIYIYVNVIKLWKYRNICIIGWTIISCILGVLTPSPPQMHRGFWLDNQPLFDKCNCSPFLQEDRWPAIETVQPCLGVQYWVMHKCGYR